jgi:hypothetical protein
MRAYLNFEQGLAYAIAELIRLYDEPTMALSILRNSGISIDNLREGHVSKYDLKVIEKAIKQKEPR